MPEIKLKKATLNEVVKAFLEWDNDREAQEAYHVVIEDADTPAAILSEMTFYAGLWYAKAHPEEVEIDENGSRKPERPIAPTFV